MNKKSKDFVGACIDNRRVSLIGYLFVVRISLAPGDLDLSLNLSDQDLISFRS